MSLPSRFPEAIYREQVVPQYRGNRWIEALPPIIDETTAAVEMMSLVTATDAERAAPAYVRLHMIEGIAKSFLQPLNQHLTLFSNISVLLRSGYVHRDPGRPEFLRTLLQGATRIENLADGGQPQQNLGPGSGHALIGISGIGKTTAVEAVLKCYPQVIPHPNLHGSLKSVHQIVWLKLSCSHDGSTAELCRMFFELIDGLLGTSYVGMYCKTGSTVNFLRSAMARVAFLHGLGLLVVDELQNLNAAKSGGVALMMNFFKLLRDVMKVPMLLVGTEAAENILGGDFQVARRHAGMPKFDRMKKDDGFELFLESLFLAQYLRSPIALTQPLIDQLYDLSQGITDLVVQLFVRAQARALMCGVESLSADLFQEVYQDSFGLLHVFLEMMRRGIKVPHHRWDTAMLAAQLTAFDPAGDAQIRQPAVVDRILRATSEVPSVTTAGATVKAVVGVKKRIRRVKGAESRCLLLTIVQDGKEKQAAPYDTLLKAGFIRSLGAEALAS